MWWSARGRSRVVAMGSGSGELQSITQHTPTTQPSIVIVLAMKQLLPTSTSQYR